MTRWIKSDGDHTLPLFFPIWIVTFNLVMRFDGSILERSPLFADLDRFNLDRLVRCARLISFEKNSRIFQQGDPSDGCYSILDGVVRVSVVSSDGHDTLLAMAGKGDVVGEMGLIDNEPRSATLTTVSPASMAFLAARDFQSVADSNPLIYKHMLEILSGRLRATNETVALPKLLSLPGRLAKTLLRISEHFGEPLGDNRILIRQKFTQIELAEIAGVARENVNRQIRSWVQSGVITKRKSCYCLEDTEALRKLAEL